MHEDGDDEGWPGLAIWLWSWWFTLTRYHWFSAARRDLTDYAGAAPRGLVRPVVTVTDPRA